MRKLYVVTTEYKGDGSWNYTDHYRPGISVYTDINKALKASIEYMYKYAYPFNRKDFYGDCDSKFKERIELNDKNEISNFKRRKLFNHLLDRIELDEDSWIRIETTEINASKLKETTPWYNYPDKTHVCHGFWKVVYEYGVEITKKSDNPRLRDFLTRTTYLIDKYIL
jgi:hypothetical protein